MNIYDSIKKDHDEVKNMLTKLEKNPFDEGLFKQLMHELESHNKAEEIVFYDSLKEKLEEL